MGATGPWRGRGRGRGRERGGEREGEKFFIDNQEMTEGRRGRGGGDGIFGGWEMAERERGGVGDGLERRGDGEKGGGRERQRSRPCAVGR
jgi:hypothetical protein